MGPQNRKLSHDLDLERLCYCEVCGVYSGGADSLVMNESQVVVVMKVLESTLRSLLNVDWKLGKKWDFAYCGYLSVDILVILGDKRFEQFHPGE